MRLHEVEIHNYKSLRNVFISPSPLSVLIGPNAAGKSNFCDALDFLGEAYRLGLEIAVARKGGYENLCYRRLRRSKAPIRFRIKFELTPEDWHGPPYFSPRALEKSNTIFEHAFELRAESQSIGAPFFVSLEELQIRYRRGSRGQPPEFGAGEEKLLFAYSRERQSIIELDTKGLQDLANVDHDSTISRFFTARMAPERFKENLPETEFLLPLVDRMILGVFPFQRAIGSLRVFQLSPRNCREAGVPTPNPEMDRFGGNLPAVIEYLKGAHQKRYETLLEIVRRVMPTLAGLETQYTHRKTLGLLVTEDGVGRPWAPEDISDGTIQTIALLAAVFDPRTFIVIIEEPENSVHPWAIRQFIEAARKAAETKQVILTTHSPVLIDKLRPEELWVVTRPKAETRVEPILSLDPALQSGWVAGDFTLSEYLDSGAIPQAVPTE
jgi:predicted ATPase